MEGMEQVLKILLEALDDGHSADQQAVIPLGISNRHIHLSQQDLEILFGREGSLTKLKDLSQPGQYAAKECVTICGPKGAIEKVRILGPVRPQTQVEILRSDCFKLGINAPVKMSGDLSGTPGITIVGPKGSVCLEQGVMVAQRHIHMTLADADRLQVQDGQIVTIQFDGLRGGSFNNVIIRANQQSALECHLDMEEANALDLTSKSILTIHK